MFNRFCPLLFCFRWLIFIFLVLEIEIQTIRKNRTEHTFNCTNNKTFQFSNRIFFRSTWVWDVFKMVLQLDLRTQIHKFSVFYDNKCYSSVNFSIIRFLTSSKLTQTWYLFFFLCNSMLFFFAWIVNSKYATKNNQKYWKKKFE